MVRKGSERGPPGPQRERIGARRPVVEGKRMADGCCGRGRPRSGRLGAATPWTPASSHHVRRSRLAGRSDHGGDAREGASTFLSAGSPCRFSRCLKTSCSQPRVPPLPRHWEALSSFPPPARDERGEGAGRGDCSSARLSPSLPSTAAEGRRQSANGMQVAQHAVWQPLPITSSESGRPARRLNAIAERAAWLPGAPPVPRHREAFSCFPPPARIERGEGAGRGEGRQNLSP